jgi:hypothetical protein
MEIVLDTSALINTNDINLIWTPYNANESKNVSNFVFKQKSKYEAKDLGTSNLTKWTTQAALGYLNTRDTLEG